MHPRFLYLRIDKKRNAQKGAGIMKRIFMDLEMNPVSGIHKEARSICSREVIEIGAVMLDDRNKEISRFQCYVRPEYCNGITKHITNITGIETAQVAEAECFYESFLRFCTWCGTDYEIYSWSDSDPVQLQKEMLLKRMPVLQEFGYMFTHWHDLQKEFDEMLFCERRIGLKAAVKNAGLEFRGRAHSALSDAEATADLYREMTEGKMLIKINSILSEAKRPIGTSLGDLLGGIAVQAV